MNAKIKFGITILAVTFLLLNPIGACASMSMSNPPMHPCCPDKPAGPAGCHDVGCICVNSPQAPIIIPPNTDHAPVLAFSASAAWDLVQVGCERPGYEPTLFAPHDGCVSFHQLLL